MPDLTVYTGMKLPVSFNEVTVGEFQECYFILKKDPSGLESWARVISILGRVPYEKITAKTPKEIRALASRLLFLLDHNKTNQKVKKYIHVNGKVYRAVYEANKLTAAQGVDIKTFMKGEGSQEDIVVENAHKLLASIYIPFTGWGFKYDPVNHKKIANDFLSVKMGDVLGTLFFYSVSWEKLIEAYLPYMNEAQKTIQTHLEVLKQWQKGSTITGDGR